jgi:hypothetical protein
MGRRRGGPELTMTSAVRMSEWFGRFNRRYKGGDRPLDLFWSRFAFIDRRDLAQREYSPVVFVGAWFPRRVGVDRARRKE